MYDRMSEYAACRSFHKQNKMLFPSRCAAPAPAVLTVLQTSLLLLRLFRPFCLDSGCTRRWKSKPQSNNSFNCVSGAFRGHASFGHLFNLRYCQQACETRLDVLMRRSWTFGAFAIFPHGRDSFYIRVWSCLYFC